MTAIRFGAIANPTSFGWYRRAGPRGPGQRRASQPGCLASIALTSAASAARASRASASSPGVPHGPAATHRSASTGTAPLFDRGREGVRLTPVGEALLPHARQVLGAWDRGWAEAERAKSRQPATLVAGMSTSPGRGGLLPAVRSRFTALHPEATVQLRQVSWDDPTAGLADGTVDMAFVWLPLPDPARYRWIVVAEEQRLVAMPDSHPLASRDVINFADLLDEPFLALPQSAGPLRDYWLAIDARGGRSPRIGAEIASTDETYEALVDGRGVCLLAAGNAPLVTLGGVTTRPVHGISPSQLALAWRISDTRPLVLDYAHACRQATCR